MIRHILKAVFVATLALATFGLTIWGSAALWYRAPGGDWIQLVLSGAFGLLGVMSFAAWLRTAHARSLAPFVVLTVLLLGWWSTLHAPRSGNWSPDVARQVIGTINGDILTLDGIRNFDWQMDGRFVENWERQSFDLSTLTSTDLFLSYWAGPQMAHFVLSFGFADGQFLAWSIEVRREIDGGFSPIADLFKENALVIIAATERDVIGLRTNIRQEDVQLFRLNTQPDRARALLEEYVRDANALAEKPQWYNSIATNCTTVVLKMLNAIGDGPSLNWRMIANGYLPDYGYDRGSLSTNYTLDELRQRGRVSQKGQAFGLGPGFSEAIREGVPSP